MMITAPPHAVLHPPAQSVRLRQITRLLWASIALSVATFASSMVFFGINTFFLSPPGFGLVLAFNITLLTLAAKEHGRKREGVVAASQPGDVPEKYDSASEKTMVSAHHPIRPFTPVLTRKWTIFLAFFMALYWLAPVALLIMYIVLSKVYNWDEPEDHKRMIMLIVELVFDVAQIGVMLAVGVLCVKERKEIANRNSRGTSKQYQEVGF